MPKKEQQDSKFIMEKYKQELTRYYRKQDKYNENKSRVFVVVMGQCTLTMKNKLESLRGHQKMEDDNDVVGLLHTIKELSFSNY